MRRPSAGRPNADGQDHVVRRGEKSFALPRCRRVERSKGEGESSRGDRPVAPTEEGRVQGRRLPAEVAVEGDLVLRPAALRGAVALHAPVDPHAGEEGRKIFRPYAGGPGSEAVLPHRRSGVHRIFHPHAAPPSVRVHIIDVDRNKAGDSLQEVLRLHDALRRLFPNLRFGSERDAGERLDALPEFVECVETSKRIPTPPQPSPPPRRPFDTLRVLAPSPSSSAP